MKKILSALLVLTMLFSSVSVALPAEAVTHGYYVGDVDDSGEIDMKDMLSIRKYLLGIFKDKDINVKGSDLNTSGAVDMNDLLSLRRILLGLDSAEGNNTDGKYKVDAIYIDNRNINRFTIVRPSGSNECMKYATTELRDYISDACGVTLNITSNESSVTGYKIKFVYDTQNNYDLGKEGYRVSVEENGDLLVNCGSMRAPLYASYFILEELIGWRFLSVNFDKFDSSTGYKRYDTLTHLYEADRIDIPGGYAETEVPRFEYRAANQAGGHQYNFAQRRLNATDGGPSGYSTNAKYGGGVGTTLDHAHSFDDQCGVDPSTQPCLTSEETFNQIVTYTTNYLIDRNKVLGKDYTQVPCSPNDNTDFCQCSECKQVYAVEGSIAGTVFRLANRVADALDERFPGIEIYTIAYWDARNPPTMTRPHDNVCVCFCIGGCNNHPYDDVQACIDNGGNERLTNKFTFGDEVSSNAYDLVYYERWCELTNNIYIWYYSSSYHCWLAPSPNVFNIYNDLKYCASTGTIGVYFEGSYDSYYTFQYLKGYLAAKMMWDPFMSEEEFNSHLNEFLMLYYGDGWEYIREYLEMSNYSSDILGCWTNNFDRPFNMYSKEYYAENYHTMRQLFDNAQAATNDAEQKFRIMLCRLHCDFLGLSATYESDYVNGTGSVKELYITRYKEFYNNVVNYNIKVSSYTDAKYGCENFPSSANEIIEPMRWIFEDFTGKWEWEGGRWV